MNKLIFLLSLISITVLSNLNSQVIGSDKFKVVSTTGAKVVTVDNIALYSNSNSTRKNLFYDARDFGVTGDGTNCTVAFNKMIDSVLRIGGGTIVFPDTLYEIDSIRFNRYLQTTILINGSNGTGDTIQVQAPIILAGKATQNYGEGNVLMGGTIFHTNSAAKIFLFTKGLGKLTLENIGFSNKGKSSLSTFVKTTNTTLDIQKCFFEGRGGGYGSSDDTCIILGGILERNNKGDSAAFQGYGTFISNNNFSKISVAIRFGTYANAVWFRNNNIWTTCGNNNGAPIILNSGFRNGSSVAGNYITENLVEVNNYKFGVDLQNGVSNCYFNNSFFDANPPITVAAYNICSNCNVNTIVNTMRDGSIKLKIDSSGYGNLITTAEPGDTSITPNYALFKSTVTFDNNGYSPSLMSPKKYVQLWHYFQDSTLFYNFQYPSGSSVDMFAISKKGGTYDLTFQAPVQARITNSQGALRLQNNTNELWLSNDLTYSLGDGTWYYKGQNQPVIKFTNTGQIGWSGNTAPSGGYDVFMSRISSGLLGVFGNATSNFAEIQGTDFITTSNNGFKNKWYFLTDSIIRSSITFPSGLATDLLQLSKNGSTTDFQIFGSVQGRLYNSIGDLRISHDIGATNNYLWLAGNQIYFYGGDGFSGGQMNLKLQNGDAIKLTNSASIGFSQTAAPAGGSDVAITRLSAGVLGVVTGANNNTLQTLQAATLLTTNLGIGTTVPSYRLDVASNPSIGNPIRLIGLQPGATTDSLITSNAGVITRNTPIGSLYNFNFYGTGFTYKSTFGKQSSSYISDFDTLVGTIYTNRVAANNYAYSGITRVGTMPTIMSGFNDTILSNLKGYQSFNAISGYTTQITSLTNSQSSYLNQDKTGLFLRLTTPTNNNRSIRFDSAGITTTGSFALNMKQDTFVVAPAGAVNFQGIKYATDYSANYTTRSLVDKAYVDNATGTSVPYVYSNGAGSTNLVNATTTTVVWGLVTDIVGNNAVSSTTTTGTFDTYVCQKTGVVKLSGVMDMTPGTVTAMSNVDVFLTTYLSDGTTIVDSKLIGGYAIVAGAAGRISGTFAGSSYTTVGQKIKIRVFQNTGGNINLASGSTCSLMVTQ